MAAHYPQAAQYGYCLRQIREHQGEGLKVIAKKAGISFQHLARIEKGEINTPVETLAKIAEALGTTLASIVLYAAGKSIHEGQEGEETDDTDIEHHIPFQGYDVIVHVRKVPDALPPGLLRRGICPSAYYFSRPALEPAFATV